MARRKLEVGDVNAAFDMLNRRYWGGVLARPRIVLIPAGQNGALMDSRCDWGAYGIVAGEPLIELREVDGLVHKGFWRANLLHEMVHHAIGVDHDHRSRRWREEVRRISLLGALRETI